MRFSANRNLREITSPASPLIKTFRRALAGGLTREGWLAGEGPRFLAEALKPGSAAVVKSVLLAESGAQSHRELLDSLPSGTDIARIPDRLFRRISLTETPQGIAALIERPVFDLCQTLQIPNALLIVACGVQDPGNIGSIVRSAAALGASAVITLHGTVSPFNPKAVRSSVGAIFELPVFAGIEVDDFFRRVQEHEIAVLAAVRNGETALAASDLRGPVAILMGNEGAGLPPEIASRAGQRISIPIRPQADSLNAAAAAAIILYEAAKQRGFSF